MKKHLIYLIIGIVLLSACEKDDFCTRNPVTSKLILRFYDASNTGNLKKVQRFSIIANGKTDSLTVDQNLDSIAIPLNPNQPETSYTFKTNTGNGAISQNQLATFTIQYITEDDYVSRSCGFRVVFKDLTFTNSNTSWIQSFTPNTVINLDDQSKAHVQIFH